MSPGPEAVPLARTRHEVETLSGALNGTLVRTPAWVEALRQLRIAAAAA
jgi:hypothetical protein